jgi:hypothetical protein
MTSAELARHRDQQRTRLAAIAVAALGVASCLALVLVPAAPAQAQARLDVLAAAVELKLPGDAGYGPISSSVDLAAGSAIRTSTTGLAEVGFADGSLTRVGPDSDYSLSTLEIGADRRQIVGRLDLGRTFHRVSKVTGSDSRFEVHTSKAVAAVRGTAFAVQCLTAASCEVAVTEGTVAVITPDGRSVDVTAGHRVVIDAEGSMGAVERIPRGDDWIEQNSTPAASVTTTSSPAGASDGAESEEGTTTAGDGSGLQPALSSDTTLIPPGTPRPLDVTGAEATPGATGTTGTTRESSPAVPTSLDPSTSVPCPGYQGDPQRTTPGATDGAPSPCVPCDAGEASSGNPNCAGSAR